MWVIRHNTSSNNTVRNRPQIIQNYDKDSPKALTQRQIKSTSVLGVSLAKFDRSLKMLAYHKKQMDKHLKEEKIEAYWKHSKIMDGRIETLMEEHKQTKKHYVESQGDIRQLIDDFKKDCDIFSQQATRISEFYQSVRSQLETIKQNSDLDTRQKLDIEDIESNINGIIEQAKRIKKRAQTVKSEVFTFVTDSVPQQIEKYEENIASKQEKKTTDKSADSKVEVGFEQAKEIVSKYVPQIVECTKKNKDEAEILINFIFDEIYQSICPASQQAIHPYQIFALIIVEIGSNQRNDFTSLMQNSTDNLGRLINIDWLRQKLGINVQLFEKFKMYMERLHQNEHSSMQEILDSMSDFTNFLG